MSVHRRTILAAAGALAAGLPAGAIARRAFAGEAPETEIDVVADEPIGRIDPLVYGHFAEHIGTLIYGGIWAGLESKIPHQAGYRLDVLQALRRVAPSIVRWPGGCFADAYHWQDGVGPAESRTPRFNHWWQREEPNTFGTNEFIGWCRRLGAEPYLSVNVGTGGVDEALHWLEYCNGIGQSEFAALRAKHGHERPHGVKWWGIGNENWGCGGLMTPDEYAQQFRQYAVYLKRLGLSTDLQLVGVGHTADDWNRKFLAGAGAGLPYLDHLSVHRYFRRGHSIEFTDQEYLELMLDASDFETTIVDALRAIDEVAEIRNRIPVFGPLKPQPIGLVIDEWGVWHSDARLEDGFRQRGALREALFAASCLNLFHRHARRISMTSIAQSIDCLQSLVLTAGDSIVLTPTFHVYEMYRPHQGAESLRTEVAKAPGLSSGPRTHPAVSVSASRNQDAIYATLVNQHPTTATECALRLRGVRPRSAEATALVAESVRTQNTPEQPRAAAPQPLAARVDSNEIRLALPAASVTALKIALGA